MSRCHKEIHLHCAVHVALPKGSWLIQQFLQWKLKGEVRNPRHATNDLNTLPEAPPKPTPKNDDFGGFWTFFHEQIPPS